MIKQKKDVTNRVLLKSRLRTNNSKSLTPTHRRSSSRFQCKHPIFRNTYFTNGIRSSNDTLRQQIWAKDSWITSNRLLLKTLLWLGLSAG